MLVKLSISYALPHPFCDGLGRLLLQLRVFEKHTYIVVGLANVDNLSKELH